MRSIYLAGEGLQGYCRDIPDASDTDFHERHFSYSSDNTETTPVHSTNGAPTNANEPVWEVVRHTIKVEDLPVELQSSSGLKGTFEGLFGDGSVENAVLTVDCSELRTAVKAHRRALRKRFPKPDHVNQNRSCFPHWFPTLAIGRRIRDACIDMQRPVRQRCTEFYMDILRLTNLAEPSLQEREEKIRELYDRIVSRQKAGGPKWLDPSDQSPRMDSIEATMKSVPPFRKAAQTLCPRVRVARRMLVQLCKTFRADAHRIYRLACNSVDETTGFVTFTKAQAYAMATQMLLRKDARHGYHATIIAKRAPFPKDIIWRNITVPDQVVRMRCLCSFPLIILVILLWSGVSSVIQALTDWQFLKTTCKEYFPSVYAYINQKLIGFPVKWVLRMASALLVGYLPVLAWLLFISVTPHFFRMWFVKVERHKQWSKIVRLSFDRYFLVQIISFYVTVFAGSFIETNPDPLKLTQSVLSKTVSKMDSVSGYFTCLILTKLGLRGANYMLRPGPCIEWMIRYWGNVARNEAPPSKNAIQEPLIQAGTNGHRRGEDYKGYKGSLGGWQAEKLLSEGPFFERVFTDVALSLSLCMMYCVMSPVVIFAGVAYFGVVAILMRYNLLFVYIQDHDSGGEIFFSLFNKSVTSLLASLLLLQTYLMAAVHPFAPQDASSFVVHAAMPILMILVIAMWYMIHKTYTPLCTSLSLEEALRKDAKGAKKHGIGDCTSGIIFPKKSFA